MGNGFYHQRGHLDYEDSFPCPLGTILIIILAGFSHPGQPLRTCLSSDHEVALFVFPQQFKFWAWDPEEERRRQEKWQQEQERLLQVGPTR